MEIDLREMVQKLILPGLLMILLTGCSSSVVDRQTSDELPTMTVRSGELTAKSIQASRMDDHLDSLALYNYVAGLLAEEQGEHTSAVAFYKRALVHYADSYEIGYSLARLYYRLRKPDLALEVLKEIIPRDQDVYRLSAGCFRLLGDSDAYRAAYRNVLRIDPDDAEAYSRLGHAYLRLNDLDSAIWAYESLSRVRATDYHVWAQLGRMYIDIGDTLQARAAYRRSAEVNNSIDNLRTIVSLGDLYESGGLADSATMTYDRALEVDPANTVILNLMVQRATQHERFTEAVPYAQRLIQVLPDDFAQARRLGMILFYMDSLNLADSVFSDIVSRGDEHDLNHHFLGMIATAHGQFERARDQFLIMSQMADTSSATWLNLGHAYRKLGQFDMEIETYREALKTIGEGKGQDKLMFALGAAHEQNSQYDEAVAVFEELLVVDPNFHAALNYLGYMLADKGERLQYAMDLITRAVKLSPDKAAYLDSYGWVYFRLGDYDKALHYLKKAAKLDSDPVILDHLGDAHEANGEMDLARQWWRKALELEPDNVAIMEKLNR
jgi:tetratricopeptide (TPR) repeat protein